MRIVQNDLQMEGKNCSAVTITEHVKACCMTKCLSDQVCV